MARATSASDSTHRARTHSRAVATVVLAVAYVCGSLGAAQAAPASAPPGPKIYSVSATPRIAHAGDAVHWDAHVSLDVVTVTARVAVYTFSLYPVASGHFGEVFRIPRDVPPFFHGNYSVTITATNATGASATRSIALRFQ